MKEVTIIANAEITTITKNVKDNVSITTEEAKAALIKDLKKKLGCDDVVIKNVKIFEGEPKPKKKLGRKK